MRTIKHPLSGATYDLRPDGLVEVTSRTGSVGIFDREGRWQSGELHQVDPHVCVWITGKEVLNAAVAAMAADQGDKS